MNNKRSTVGVGIMLGTILAFASLTIYVGTVLAPHNTELQSELNSAKQEVAKYEQRLEYLEVREIQLLNKLESAEQTIESKDAELLSLGYQPYELLPCFNCGNAVAIIAGEEGDCYYIKCTHCTVLFGPYATIGYAEGEWNFIDE